MSDIVSFNVPKVVITPVLDINGNLVTNPTPLMIEGIQSFDLMMKGSIKELMVDKQFSIAAARGDQSLNGKLKGAKTSVELIHTMYSGQGYSTATAARKLLAKQTGTVTTNAIVVGPTGTGIATGTGNTVLEDMGVVTQFDTPMLRVATAPNAGEYTVAIASGVATYTFNAAEISAGLVPYVSVVHTIGTAATGTVHRTLNINNLQGGQTPVIKLTVYATFEGKGLLLTMPWVICSNFNFLQMKSLDFATSEMDFNCMPDKTVSQTILSGFFVE